MVYSARLLLVLSLLILAPASFADTANISLTIYNQNFAVVRQPISLDLTAGDNQVTVTDVTAQLEPDSVVLRDPTGVRSLQIFEQNYLADPINQARLLNESVGKTIEFVKFDGTIVHGKVIRSVNRLQDDRQEPIIEVDGKLQFFLPGQPQFASLGADLILKPTLDWTLVSDKPGPLDAELSYVTGGLTWSASYNLVAPEGGGALELTGWVTMQNDCGRDFENAKIKLMAGDINKIDPNRPQAKLGLAHSVQIAGEASFVPRVTEEAFDEYHLYTLERPTTLRSGETKQVEFVRSAVVNAKTTYTYDGVDLANDPLFGNASNYDYIRGQRQFGTLANTKVWIGREFKNSKANGLGIPLPKGKTRFYQRDSDGHLEFLGEDIIDHTPTDENVHLRTGNAFDLVGERTQTDYQVQNRGMGNSSLDESFKIVLRNHKSTAADIRVVEHLYRGPNWTISTQSDVSLKTDAKTMEFMTSVPPSGEKTITYTVHYTW